MGFTAVEKTLAAKSGKACVKPGDVVFPDPDFVMIHDGVVMGAKRELDALGIGRLKSPEKVVMVTDHDVIYGSARAAERGAYNREAARRWGVTNFFDVGRGGHGHVFPMETGMLLPGMFYFDNDRHATNAGAIGAFGFRMGTEISRVLATGTNWVMVPKSVRLTIRGQLRPGVHARDVGFRIAAIIVCWNIRATSTSSISPHARRSARVRPRCARTACSFHRQLRYSNGREPM